MAFGTGTHPTTVMSLQALEKYMTEDSTVIDVGTGSGVLAIGSAMLGAQHVHALDLDEVAVRSAKLNVKLNKVQDHVEVVQGNLLDTVKEPAEIVVANILAEIIMTFIDNAYRLVRPNGYFIASGIIETKKEEVKTALEKAGFVIEEVMMMEDWVTIISRKAKD